MDNLEVKVELLNGDLLENYRALEALQKSVHDRLKACWAWRRKSPWWNPRAWSGSRQGQAHLDLRTSRRSKRRPWDEERKMEELHR